MPRSKHAKNLFHQSNCVAHITAAYTTVAKALSQNSLMKNFKMKEPKALEMQLSAHQHFNNAEKA